MAAATDELRLGILAFGAVALFLVVSAFFLYPGSEQTWRSALEGIHTEVTGFLFDVALFGVILVWFRSRWETRSQTELAHSQLDAILTWDAEEGIRRKVEIIRQLNRKGYPLPSMKGVKLRGATLGSADLVGVSFEGADLGDACLRTAKLVGAKFFFAMLDGTDFNTAKLDNAIFTFANLIRADLRGANLTNAVIETADLTNANLSYAQVRGVSFAGSDLSSTCLAHAWNLTQEQLDSAYICEGTPAELPSGFRQPPSR